MISDTVENKRSPCNLITAVIIFDNDQLLKTLLPTIHALGAGSALCGLVLHLAAEEKNQEQMRPMSAPARCYVCHSLVYCAGRAQLCFLTILRIPLAVLARLGPESFTLHPAPRILYPMAAPRPAPVPHPCICAYACPFAPRYKINLYCTPQQAHARQHLSQTHMRRIIFIPAAAPDTPAMRRHVRAHTYN